MDTHEIKFVQKVNFDCTNRKLQKLICLQTNIQCLDIKTVGDRISEWESCMRPLRRVHKARKLLF